MASEAQLQQQVADYIRLRYPGVIFHSDYGSGVKLTARQAAIQKRQNGGIRSWPDMFIAHPRLTPREHYCGLFIEFKVVGARLKKKNGDWASNHIAEQAEMLQKLQQLGFVARFAVGFDQAKAIIDDYLEGV